MINFTIKLIKKYRETYTIWMSTFNNVEAIIGCLLKPYILDYFFIGIDY